MKKIGGHGDGQKQQNKQEYGQKQPEGHEQNGICAGIQHRYREDRADWQNK